MTAVEFVRRLVLLFVLGPFVLVFGFGNSEFRPAWSRKDADSRGIKNSYFIKLAAKSRGIRITSAEAFDEVLHVNSPDKPIQLVLFTAGKYDSKRYRNNV